jgi:hypothetical protein
MKSSETKKHALPPLSLTERDVQMLKTIADCTGLTAPQLSTLFFPPAYDNGKPVTHSNCKYRLKLLYQHGYLVRVEQPHLAKEGRKPYVYVLSKKAAQLLATWLDCPVTELSFYRMREQRFSSPFLDHLIRTNDVRVALIKAVERSGHAHISTWLDEVTLRQLHSHDTLVIKGAYGKQHQTVLVPDSYFLLHTEQPEIHDYHTFVEIDLGSERTLGTDANRQDFAHKITLYQLYYTSGLYQKRYGAQGMRVLIVTTSATRLTNLKQITERMGGKTRFWFTTFAAIMADDYLLTTPIWQIASKDGFHPLIW